MSLYHSKMSIDSESRGAILYISFSFHIILKTISVPVVHDGSRKQFHDLFLFNEWLFFLTVNKETWGALPLQKFHCASIIVSTCYLCNKELFRFFLWETSHGQMIQSELMWVGDFVVAPCQFLVGKYRWRNALPTGLHLLGSKACAECRPCSQASTSGLPVCPSREKVAHSLPPFCRNSFFSPQSPFIWGRAFTLGIQVNLSLPSSSN